MNTSHVWSFVRSFAGRSECESGSCLCIHTYIEIVNLCTMSAPKSLFPICAFRIVHTFKRILASTSHAFVFMFLCVCVVVAHRCFTPFRFGSRCNVDLLDVLPDRWQITSPIHIIVQTTRRFSVRVCMFFSIYFLLFLCSVLMSIKCDSWTLIEPSIENARLN